MVLRQEFTPTPDRSKAARGQGSGPTNHRQRGEFCAEYFGIWLIFAQQEKKCQYCATLGFYPLKQTSPSAGFLRFTPTASV